MLFKKPSAICKLVLAAVTLLSTTFLAAGCGGKPATAPPQATPVKAMKVVVQDAPIILEFVGEVAAKQSIALKPKVSGQIVANMVEGGAAVRQGQPLFRIDPRDYEAALYNAQATLANARASLSNSRLDLERYRALVAQEAISRQQFDQAQTTETQYAAAVQANEALLRKAQNDLDDTIVTSPIDGRIDIQDLSTGNFAKAGETVLANISSIDPIHVRFSMSESNYLNFINRRGADANTTSGYSLPLSIMLGNGSTYSHQGRVVQVDKGLSGSTGTLTLKAEFPNPERILVPGMFARVVVELEVRKGALLVPQRAIQEILGKTFISVIGEGEKAESRAVKLGAKHGSYQLVEEGLTASDIVIVEGLTKIRAGSPVKATMMQPDEIAPPAAK